MKINGRATARIVSRRLKLAAFIASLVLIPSTPILPAERADPYLLPTNVRYTRNSKCNAVNIHMPRSRHSAVDENMISPKPADMPLSQGDSAICFAYATADMISQRVGTEVSPLDVATKYYFADPSRLAQSTNPDLQRHLRGMGDYRAAIAEARATMEVSVEDNPSQNPYIDKLEDGDEGIAALLYNIGGLCRDQDLPSYDGFSHFSGYLDLLRKWMEVFPPAQYSRMSLAGAAPAALSPKTDAFNAVWISRVERQCRRRPLPAPLLPVSYRVSADQASLMQVLAEGRPPSDAQVDRMFSMIDYALDNGRAPAVGYSWFALEAAAPEDTDLAADHLSVIIGRRKVGTTCQYRVQDNTGEYCSRMREGAKVCGPS
jgi:hypothetical protein